jgi:hypothetical protein
MCSSSSILKALCKILIRHDKIALGRDRPTGDDSLDVDTSGQCVQRRTSMVSNRGDDSQLNPGPMMAIADPGRCT